MCGLKCSIRVVAIALVIQSGHLISAGHNGTAEILWNLSQLAVQSRQVNNPSQFQLHPEKFAEYTGPVKPRRPYGYLQNYPRPYPPKAPRPLYRPPVYPVPVPIPALPPGYQRYPQSFTEALASVALNDEFRCIPKLLCELTSGQKQESVLPFNVDMDSVVGFLSGVSGTESSPLLHFGKAILMGYSGKGGSRSCTNAYPRCPQDPDRLVEYLNNHNGGFFRLFNGAPGFPQIPQQLPFPPGQQLPFPPGQQLPFPPGQQLPFPPGQQLPFPPGQQLPFPPGQQLPFPPGQQLPFPPGQQLPFPPGQQTPYPFPFPQAAQPPQRYPSHLQKYPNHPQQYPPYYRRNRPEDANQVDADKRIQNQRVQYVSGVRFPNHLWNDLSNEVEQIFPTRIAFADETAGAHKDRRGKALAFPARDNLEKPDLQPAVIFPDNTGSGKLRLDGSSHLGQLNRGAYYRKLKENNLQPLYGSENPFFRFPFRNEDT